MRTRTIIMVVVTGIAFLAGCTRDEVAPEIDKTIPPEIDEGIRDAYDTYLRNLPLARKKRDAVWRKQGMQGDRVGRSAETACIRSKTRAEAQGGGSGDADRRGREHDKGRRSLRGIS